MTSVDVAYVNAILIEALKRTAGWGYGQMALGYWYIIITILFKTVVTLRN